MRNTGWYSKTPCGRRRPIGTMAVRHHIADGRQANLTPTLKPVSITTPVDCSMIASAVPRNINILARWLPVSRFYFLFMKTN